MYSPASPHFSFTYSAEVKRRRFCQLHNHTTHPVPTQQPTVDAPRLTCCAAIEQVHKGCPLSFNIPPIWEPTVDAPRLTCCEAPQMKETRRKTTGTLSFTKVSAVLNPTSSPKTMYSLLPPAHSPMGLGFIDPGRPQTEEREENNAPRIGVGGQNACT